MAQWSTLKLTNHGAILLAQAQAGAKFTITRVALGSGEWDEETDFREAEELLRHQTDLTVSSREIVSDTELRIRCFLDNVETMPPFFAREIGVYAKTEESEEVLYAIGVDSNPDEIKEITSVNISSFQYDIICVISTDAEFDVVVSPAGFISSEEFEAHYEGSAADAAVHGLRVVSGILHYKYDDEWYSTLQAGIYIDYVNGTVPPGYLKCDGTAYSRGDYPELFEVLKTFPGNAETANTFKVPDFRGRLPYGEKSSSFGTRGGSETITLSSGNLPAHSHSASTHKHDMYHTHGTASFVLPSGIAYFVGGNVGHSFRHGEDRHLNYISNTGMQYVSASISSLSTRETSSAATSIGSTGEGRAFTVLPPYMTVNKLISHGKSLIS